ncbi:thiol-disulfide oxidoreductase [Cesiribacter andamanensis AMV16]|uniref:Thiol-disulfide oxidoreductase n=2 Tax=Cesiribacter TaxID=1133570 RepID=M7NUE3_9BACT|nr:thiol-disulfide oxidoreductase [Cesiribacter andamanensis AMV16]
MIQGYAQGSAAGDFSLPDAVSGKTVSLADYKGQKAVVLVFTSNYCPYSRLYEERLNQLVNQYKGRGVAFVFINANDPQQNKEESDESMKSKVEEWGTGVPFLSDRKQTVAKKYGASKTPEVFVLAPRGGGFQVFYSGAIDDNPQVAQDVSQPYLKQALDQLLAGKSALHQQKRPVGCAIKLQ